MPKIAHKLVASVAREAAGELYDCLMSDNSLFEMWKKQNPGLTPKALESRFIVRNSARCLAFARATLSHMLSRPDVDETTKSAIYEALLLDASIPVARVSRAEAQRTIKGMMQ